MDGTLICTSSHENAGTILAHETSDALKPRFACLYFRPGSTSETLRRNGTAVFDLAEACFRFTSQVALRGQEAIFLEVGKSAGLFREDTLLLRLTALSQRFGLLPQIAFADSAPEALTLARFNISDGGALPLEALHDFASPFFADELRSKKVERLIHQLRLLGLTALEDFADLPIELLASRFGELGVELSLLIRGEVPVIWPGFHPPEKITERIDLFDSDGGESCYGLEPLLFALTGLVDRTVARLRGRGLRASRLGIDLELSKQHGVAAQEADPEFPRKPDVHPGRSPGAPDTPDTTVRALRIRNSRSWRIELPLPQGSTAGIIPILRDRLGFDLTRAPLTAPITAITLSVLENVPAHGAQKHLFSEEERESEAWDQLVGRLRSRLGERRAFAAEPMNRHLPEKAWAVADELPPPDGLLPFELPRRPARVLKKPLPLERAGDRLVPPRPKHGRHPQQDFGWRAVRWMGPERISCEWWQDSKFRGYNRDYFHVLTETGEHLWVFTVPGKSDLFLHGYFD